MTADMSSVALQELVDLDAYPIDQPDTDAYQAVVELARQGLRSDGCAVIKDFVLPGAQERLGAEIWERKPTTHFSTQVINPYFHFHHNADFPDQHPMNTFLERSSGFIPGDSWEDSTAMRNMFEHPALTRFLADCLEIDELHPYADPLAGLTANILDPGQQFTWHFDTRGLRSHSACARRRSHGCEDARSATRRHADLPWSILPPPGEPSGC